MTAKEIRDHEFFRIDCLLKLPVLTEQINGGPVTDEQMEKMMNEND